MTPTTTPQPTLTHDEIVAALGTLVSNGLTFSDCIGVFGVDKQTNPYAKAAADEYLIDGAIEIDDMTVLSDSDGGNYVMAWVWVSDEDAGVSREPSEAEAA